MASLNISMPKDMRTFVDRRTRQTNHATPTEYIRSLVRDDQKRAAQEKLEQMMIEGLDSGKPIVIEDLKKYAEQKKQTLLKRLKQRRKEEGSNGVRNPGLARR